MPLFQSNLRKQIRKLPKILQFVKIIHYYSELFTSLLRFGPARAALPANLVFVKPPKVGGSTFGGVLRRIACRYGYAGATTNVPLRLAGVNISLGTGSDRNDSEIGLASPTLFQTSRAYRRRLYRRRRSS